jgi:hypothetical protein
LKTDYRGVAAHLADHPALVEALELSKIPHVTTVEKAAKRLLNSAPGAAGTNADALLSCRCQLRKPVPRRRGLISVPLHVNRGTLTSKPVRHSLGSLPSTSHSSKAAASVAVTTTSARQASGLCACEALEREEASSLDGNAKL